MKHHVKVFVVAGVILRKGDRYLLVQERGKEKRGLWNWPAGRVERGMTIEQTAVKEVKEETGFDVKLVRKAGIFHESEEKGVKHVFIGRIIGGTLNVPNEEILCAGWFTLNEIKKMTNVLRTPVVLEAIVLAGKYLK